jgi:hypothetical protein
VKIIHAVVASAAMFAACTTAGAGARNEPARLTVGLMVYGDTSGSFKKYLPGIIAVVKQHLVPPGMGAASEVSSGDCLAIDRLGASSFHDGVEPFCMPEGMENPLAPASGAARLKWAEELNKLALAPAEPYTDVDGAIFAGASVLHSMNTRRKMLVLITDLKDNVNADVPKTKVLDGIAVRVLGVPRDGMTPASFEKTITAWTKHFTELGSRDTKIYGAAETRMLRNLID